MAKRGAITINESLCKGCAFCVKFCTKDCIAIKGDKFSPLGYLLPTFINEEKCNACQVCGWMCPDLAITVYEMVEA